MLKPDLLLYAASDKDADLLHFSRISIPDPFLAFRIRGKKIGIVNALEYSRTRKASALDTVLLKEDCIQDAEKEIKLSVPTSTVAKLVLWVMQRYKVKAFKIPPNFPSFLSLELLKQGLSLDVQDPLFPERLVKTQEELNALKLANKASAQGLRAAQAVLKASTIQGKKLYYEGKPLTSERLRAHVEKACLDAGAVSIGAIVAGGKQACDPHEKGSGPLRANEFIIVDVFPRSTESGYYGDMTRTFLRGTASPEQKRLIHTVLKAQKVALGTIRGGVEATLVHTAVDEFFIRSGYPTAKKGDSHTGFFHSTGHGLGLDLHERPSLSTRSQEVLLSGMTLTVEPGLYYPGLGGVRIEDAIVVEDEGCSPLAKFNYEWEL